MVVCNCLFSLSCVEISKIEAAKLLHINNMFFTWQLLSKTTTLAHDIAKLFVHMYKNTYKNHEQNYNHAYICKAFLITYLPNVFINSNFGDIPQAHQKNVYTRRAILMPQHRTQHINCWQVYKGKLNGGVSVGKQWQWQLWWGLIASCYNSQCYMCVCFMEDLFFLYINDIGSQFGIGSNSIICLPMILDK